MKFSGQEEVNALIKSGATDLLLPYSLDRRIMGIHLIMTDACNMNCEYCFYNKQAMHISDEDALATMDWLLSDSVSASPKESGRPVDLHVTFFGGEPTMREDTVMKTVLHGEEVARKVGKRVSFGVVSNFWDVNPEFVDFTVKHGMSWLASYDGFRTQDVTRRRGSNNRVITNIVRAMAAGAKIMVAQQVSPGHTADLFADMKSIFDIGVSAVFQNPVHHGTTPYTEEDFANLADAFDRIAKMTVRKRLAGVSPAEWQVANLEKHIASLQRMAQNPEQLRRFKTEPTDRTCGACKGSLAVGADGVIYPCQQMTREYDRYAMGHVRGDVFRHEIRDKFREEQFEECRDCAVVSCAPCRTQNAYRSGGDEGVVPEDVCRYQRLLMYRAMEVLNELMDKTPWYTTKPPQQNRGPQQNRSVGSVREMPGPFPEQTNRFRETP